MKESIIAGFFGFHKTCHYVTELWMCLSHIFLCCVLYQQPLDIRLKCCIFVAERHNSSNTNNSFLSCVSITKYWVNFFGKSLGDKERTLHLCFGEGNRETSQRAVSSLSSSSNKCMKRF